ncbi:hypothetical protein [Pseudonocardia kujensis]|uniref:hypothetical protein n=1 Tax=Pseudonocardia kujensis TaxID=1128675 RepID=UPI001E515196|nr:hypothetical protein [Pseudonocardia kujensis]
MPLNHNIGGPVARRHTSPTPFTPFSGTYRVGPSGYSMTFEQSGILIYSEAVLENHFVLVRAGLSIRVGPTLRGMRGNLHTRSLGHVANRKPGMVVTVS